MIKNTNLFPSPLPERRHQGFTLIELLVVVLIIGILAAIALPKYEKAVEKSRFTETMVRAKAMSNAIKLYVLANGYLPPQEDDYSIDLLENASDLTAGLTKKEGSSSYWSKNGKAQYDAFCQNAGSVSCGWNITYYPKSGEYADIIWTLSPTGESTSCAYVGETAKSLCASLQSWPGFYMSADE